MVSPKDGGINRAKTFAKALASNGYKETLASPHLSKSAPRWSVQASSPGRCRRLRLHYSRRYYRDTGTTIIKRAKNLKRAGAKNVFVFATHGVFSGNSEKLTSMSPYLDEVVVSDTIPFEENVASEAQQLKKGVKDKPGFEQQSGQIVASPTTSGNNKVTSDSYEEHICIDRQQHTFETIMIFWDRGNDYNRLSLSSLIIINLTVHGEILFLAKDIVGVC